MGKRVSRRVIAVLDAAYGRKSKTPKNSSTTPKTSKTPSRTKSKPEAKAPPKAKVDKDEGGQPRPHRKARWLHFWGQFTFELPKKFWPKPGKGHSWLRASSPEALLDLYADLRRTVLAKWPGTREWTGDTWARWMLKNGDQMTVEFAMKKK